MGGGGGGERGYAYIPHIFTVYIKGPLIECYHYLFYLHSPSTLLSLYFLCPCSPDATCPPPSTVTTVVSPSSEIGYLEYFTGTCNVQGLGEVQLRSRCTYNIQAQSYQASISDLQCPLGRFTDIADVACPLGRFMDIVDIACPLGRFTDIVDIACPLGRFTDIVDIACPLGRFTDIVDIACPLGRFTDIADVACPLGRFTDIADVACPLGRFTNVVDTACTLRENGIPS